MPRVALTVQTVKRTGIVPSYVSAESAGNSFANDGKTFLHIKNGATDVICTVLTPRGPDGQAVTERTVTVSANTDEFLGPFSPEIFNQLGALGDVVHIDFDDVTNVTIGAFRL